MSEAEVFKTVQDNILQILPNINPEEIKPEISMRDLGANSIDRSEVLINSMADLALKVPLVKFAKVSSIGELVAVLHQHRQES